jgi:chromosome partitioning protein
MNVLTIANQKGGVGKTTTAAALAVLLSRAGRQVHVIDMDPQSNLTEAFGLQDPESLLFEALSKRGPLPVVPIQDNLTLTPSSIDLARGELQFVAETGREFILRRCLERTELGEGAVVIVDSPPTLGVLAVNCLTAASTVVVVVKPGGFEMRALSRLEEVIAELRETGIRPDLNISGVILTEVQARRTINDQVEDDLKKVYPVFGRIRSEAKLVYATTEGRIMELTRSNAFDDYQQVAEQLGEFIPWFRRK